MADAPAGVRAGKAGGPHGLRVPSPADPGYVEWCRSGMPHLPTYRWNFLQCLVIFFSLFLGFAAFVATRSWTILFLSHFLYDLLSRPLVLNACRHAALLWLLVAVACVYWHFGKGSAAGPASPSAPPISADCRVDGMPGGGIAGRGIGCVHADRSPLPEGVPAVGPMTGKERG